MHDCDGVSVSIHACNNFALACTSSVSCKDPNIWHSRFGHVYDKVLISLTNKISYNVSNDF